MLFNATAPFQSTSHIYCRLLMWHCRQSIVLVTVTIPPNRHLQRSLVRVPFKALKTSHKIINNVYGNKGTVIPLQARCGPESHDRGTRRAWVVSSKPRPHFNTGKDPVPILQEAGWSPGPVWTGGKSRPHLDSIPDRPARSQSLYRLSYPAYTCWVSKEIIQTHTIWYVALYHGNNGYANAPQCYVIGNIACVAWHIRM